MDEEKPVKITISGKITYIENVTVNQAAQIMAFIDTPISTAAPIQMQPRQGRQQLIDGPSTRVTGNPREALDSSGAKTNPEKIVAFALYIAQEDLDKDAFTAEDIRPLFRRAREPVPKNFTRDLDAAIRSGWVAEGEVSGEYYVTDKASRVLDETFDGIRGTKKSSERPRTNGTKKPRKSESGSTIPEAFSEIESITSSIDGVIDYHRVAKKTDKYLWAIYKAKTLGIQSLAAKEIVWLTDQLGEAIVSSDLNGNYKQNFKHGYVNKTLQDKKARITPDGEAHLKSLETK